MIVNMSVECCISKYVLFTCWLTLTLTVLLGLNRMKGRRTGSGVLRVPPAPPPAPPPLPPAQEARHLAPQAPPPHHQRPRELLSPVVGESGSGRRRTGRLGTSSRGVRRSRVGQGRGNSKTRSRINSGRGQAGTNTNI